LYHYFEANTMGRCEEFAVVQLGLGLVGLAVNTDLAAGAEIAPASALAVTELEFDLPLLVHDLPTVAGAVPSTEADEESQAVSLKI
jgi:hypothetical protein